MFYIDATMRARWIIIAVSWILFRLKDFYSSFILANNTFDVRNVEKRTSVGPTRMDRRQPFSDNILEEQKNSSVQWVNII